MIKHQIQRFEVQARENTLKFVFSIKAEVEYKFGRTSMRAM